jgi:hypothetical protein
MPSARPILACLVALSLAVAGLEAAAYSAGFDVASNAMSFWGLVFSLLLAWWVAADARDKPHIYRPYEFGWLVLYSLPIYLPYYLLRTRGAMGLLGLLGFIVLYFLGYFLQIALWLAS